MKARIIIPLALMGLFSVGSAYAMTNTQAKHLVIAAYNGNVTDWAKLESAAKSGDALAQTWLGVYWGAKKNNAKAVYWFKKAADQGYAWAECSLGEAYHFGRGVRRDYAKAFYWTEKAADRGYADAEYNLGEIYRYGQGVPQDYAKANHWWEKAAVQGSADAEYNLGLAYYHGQGVHQDTMTAIFWWKEAVAQGGHWGRQAQHNINFFERG